MDNCKGRGFLLFRLTTSACQPPKNNRIDRICGNVEDDHLKVASACVQSNAAKDKTKDRDILCRRNMPCPLFILVGLLGSIDGNDTGDQVWRACQNQ